MSRTRRIAGRTRGPLPRALPARSDRGVVTAETMVALPVLVAVTVGMAWMVSLAATQVRVVDAARETARAVSRDESAAQAVQLGLRVAPAESRIHIADHGSSVEVTVTAEVRGPGGLFRFLPGIDVSSRAVAAKEPT